MSVGIRLEHRLHCAGWLSFYMLWTFVAPMILESRGEREAAGWVVLWLIPSAVVGGVIGLITIFWPRWYMVFLFGICSLVHLAFGLGFFPT